MIRCVRFHRSPKIFGVLRCINLLCLVETELIRRNHSAEKQLDVFMTIEVKRLLAMPFAFHFSSLKGTGDTKHWPDLWVGPWVSVAATPISCRDIELWPFSVGMLVKWVSFLSSLHWPAGECSRPRESSSVEFLDKLLVLFGYPDGSVAALLAGDLHLRYCSARFAWKLPTWRLPDRGHVRDLITDSVDGARFLVVSGWVVICFLLL